MSAGFRKIGDAETRKRQIIESRESRKLSEKEATRKQPSLKRQCELLGISKSSLFHAPKKESQETIEIMNIMDEEHNEHPYYGSRSLVNVLNMRGYSVGRKRIRRLMGLMNL